jgi:hypothetical protein
LSANLNWNEEEESQTQQKNDPRGFPESNIRSSHFKQRGLCIHSAIPSRPKFNRLLSTISQRSRVYRSSTVLLEGFSESVSGSRHMGSDKNINRHLSEQYLVRERSIHDSTAACNSLRSSHAGKKRMMKEHPESSTIEILRTVDIDLKPEAEKLKTRLCLLDGVLQADVNCYAGKIYVEYDPRKVAVENLRTTIEATIRQFEDSKIIAERGQ